MNAAAKFDDAVGLVTRDGAVVIPQAMRDAAGLVPGMVVQLTLDGKGRLVLTPSPFTPEEIEVRRQQFSEAIESIAGKYRTGQSTDDYMREIRGDYEP